MVVLFETNCVLLSAWLFVFVAGGFVFIFSMGAVETDFGNIEPPHQIATSGPRNNFLTGRRMDEPMVGFHNPCDITSYDH